MDSVAVEGAAGRNSSNPRAERTEMQPACSYERIVRREVFRTPIAATEMKSAGLQGVKVGFDEVVCKHGVSGREQAAAEIDVRGVIEIGA